MSSETIVTALFLIAAVVAAGVLINAVFPIISRTTETFGSVAHSTDNQIRTDIKIVNYFANSTGTAVRPIPDTDEAQIWLKNVGTSRIPENDLANSDIFFGQVGNFATVSHQDGSLTLSPLGSNSLWWNPGETLLVRITRTSNEAKWPISTDRAAYFAIVLPNGVKRSIEFEADITPP